VTAGPAHCCAELAAQVGHRCDRHPGPGACPDQLIGYDATFDEYGIWVHDGEEGRASSSVGIQHCPFCGAALPPSRREEWFDRLDALGLESDEAPDELRRYGWWLSSVPAE
jgi:hypothetical protein